jgi:hypothetical protein
MPAVGKKLHHKVARFYLKAWDEKGRDTKDAQVFCLQNGQIQPRNLRNVAAENHFYRLRKLSEQDVKFIRDLAIAYSPEGLKEVHEQLLWSFSLPHIAKRELEASGHATPKLMDQVDRVIREMNENLHTSIEDDFKPSLKAMLAGDLSFYSDRPKASVFCRGLAAQYLRTDLVKKTRSIWRESEFELFERIANVLVHIYSINLGRSLYIDRDRYKIVLLENTSEVPFVTADQPVINIAASPTQTEPPEKFELYYPLSPAKAMLLVEPSSVNFPRDPSVGAISANVYNSHMAAHSYQQIYGSTQQVLESLRVDFPAIRRCLASTGTSPRA